MLESIGELIELQMTHPQSTSHRPPRRNGTFDFSEDLRSLVFVQLEVGRDRHQCIDRGRRTRLFRDPSFELALTVRKRIDVERRREPPLAARDMKKSVVAQVIIDVVDRYEEGNPSPELLDIRLCIRPVLAYRVDDFGVSMFNSFSGLHTQQGGRGDIHEAPLPACGRIAE